MRVCSNPSDLPGYRNFLYKFLGNARVLFNGRDVSTDVDLADDQTGEIRTFVYGLDGNIITTDRGESVMIRQTGKVVIEHS